MYECILYICIIYMYYTYIYTGTAAIYFFGAAYYASQYEAKKLF
jgi:hypothetical protein